MIKQLYIDFCFHLAKSQVDFRRELSIWFPASADDNLLVLHNCSYHTQPHSLIVYYLPISAVFPRQRRRFFVSVGLCNAQVTERKYAQIFEKRIQTIFVAEPGRIVSSCSVTFLPSTPVLVLETEVLEFKLTSYTARLWPILRSIGKYDHFNQGCPLYLS